MAIVGAIQDGILGDWSTLAVKAVLDFISSQKIKLPQYSGIDAEFRFAK